MCSESWTFRGMGSAVVYDVFRIQDFQGHG